MSLLRFSVLVTSAAMVFFNGGERVLAADETISIEGKVTLDGKPLANGKIIFHQSDGQFIGTKIKDGKYQMKKVPTGTYTVTLEMRRETPGGKEQVLPAKYSAEDQAVLRVEVTKGINAPGAFDFLLKSK